MTEAGAVAEYVDWFNHRRLHGEIGLIPPAENEDNHYRHNTAPTTVGASVASLHHTRGETRESPPHLNRTHRWIQAHASDRSFVGGSTPWRAANRGH